MGREEGWLSRVVGEGVFGEEVLFECVIVVEDELGVGGGADELVGFILNMVVVFVPALGDAFFVVAGFAFAEDFALAVGGVEDGVVFDEEGDGEDALRPGNWTAKWPAPAA